MTGRFWNNFTSFIWLVVFLIHWDCSSFRLCCVCLNLTGKTRYWKIIRNWTRIFCRKVTSFNCNSNNYTKYIQFWNRWYKELTFSLVKYFAKNVSSVEATVLIVSNWLLVKTSSTWFVFWKKELFDKKTILLKRKIYMYKSIPWCTFPKLKRFGKKFL